jgi:PIN domain nuclease of toxin-antitoxin system
MYVTDTHALLFFAQKKYARLSSKATRLFKDADAGRVHIHVPTIVLWEIALLVTRRNLVIPQRFDYWCRSIENSPGFDIAPLDWLDVDAARKLPFQDPYDCLIAGTAIRLEVPLITRDETIAESGLVETFW